MNPILATLTAQFNRIGPASVKAGGKVYNRQGGVYDNATGIIRFDFVGRKQRGAMIADKVVVAVGYDACADLYNVKIEHFDGASFAVKTIKALDGVYAESFADVASWVN